MNIKAFALVALQLLLQGSGAPILGADPSPPADDPVATFYPPATTKPFPATPRFASAFPWDNVVAAKLARNGDPRAAYAAAAAAVLKSHAEGGVVYFPPGNYLVPGDFELVDRVALRGAPTAPDQRASKGPQGPGDLAPTTKFTFPDRSFSKFVCLNCTAAAIVNIFSDGAGVQFTQKQSAHSDPMFLVLSNVFQHVVYKYPVAPPATFYQEWPYRFSTAIAVEVNSNGLVANNLLPKATKSVSTHISLLNYGLDDEDEDEDEGEGDDDTVTHHDRDENDETCPASVKIQSVSKVVCDEEPIATFHNNTADPSGKGCCAHCKYNAHCNAFKTSNGYQKCYLYSSSCKVQNSTKAGTDAYGEWSGPHPPPPPTPPPTPKHPTHPPSPKPAPSPKPPHPHPSPSPPKGNCTMDVPFLYDNRYGIWHTNGGLPVTNVSIYQNYVHQNGRVGIMWQADDGLGTCLEEACRTAAPQLGSSVAVYANHVEVEANTVIWSVAGVHLARGSATNENRGYDQGGSSATCANSGTWFEANTGNINSQITPDSRSCKPSSYLSVDGEGLLQQIQDGQVAERNVWKDNDLSFGTKGPMALYALHAIQDMLITGNKVNSHEKIGIFGGGSTPTNGTGVHNLVCSGNTPAAECTAGA